MTLTQSRTSSKPVRFVSEAAILEALDNEWRMVAQIRGRLNTTVFGSALTAKLRDLAGAERIDRRLQPTGVLRRRRTLAAERHGEVVIEYYRRRPQT